MLYSNSAIKYRLSHNKRRILNELEPTNELETLHWCPECLVLVNLKSVAYSNFFKRRNHLMLNDFPPLRTLSLAVCNNLSAITAEQSSSSSSTQQVSSPFNASARQPSIPPKLWNEQVQNYFILLDSWLERFNILSELDKLCILISAMS